MAGVFSRLRLRLCGGLLLLLICIACHDTEEWAELVGGEELTSVSDKGGIFRLQIRATDGWTITLTNDAKQWCMVVPPQGEGNAVVEVHIVPNYNQIRRTQLVLKSGSHEDICPIVQKAHCEDLTNVVVGRLEIPRLKGEKGFLFIDHTVVYQNATIPNYSIEYCLAERHARWVAFTAYDQTAVDQVSRSDIWLDDPQIPIEFRTVKADYKGYDRGHLVASNDRRFCREANNQTFYYSNMSPQLADFNRNIWQKLEENVKEWMQNSALRDTLYVVKGGTIRSDQVISLTGENGVAVPRFYFMAVLSRKGDTYKAIAFWLEHKAYRFPYDLQGKAIAVDELEKKTGIDFFPSLPDALEDKVEAQLNIEDWVWITL